MMLRAEACFRVSGGGGGVSCDPDSSSSPSSPAVRSEAGVWVPKVAAATSGSSAAPACAAAPLCTRAGMQRVVRSGKKDPPLLFRTHRQRGVVPAA